MDPESSLLAFALRKVPKTFWVYSDSFDVFIPFRSNGGCRWAPIWPRKSRRQRRSRIPMDRPDIQGRGSPKAWSSPRASHFFLRL